MGPSSLSSALYLYYYHCTILLHRDRGLFTSLLPYIYNMTSVVDFPGTHAGIRNDLSGQELDDQDT
jgi:hypothetical protein